MDTSSALQKSGFSAQVKRGGRLGSPGRCPQARVAAGQARAEQAPLGSSAGPQACLWLSPFVLSCALYFLLSIPTSEPSCLAALVKCLPVLSLVLFLRAQPSGQGSGAPKQAALLCSAVGDACLIWHESAFLCGVAQPGAHQAPVSSGVGAFAMAHLLYLWDFGLTPLRLRLLLPVGLASAPYLVLLLLRLPPGMVLPLAGYGLLLAAMLWRGLARGGGAAWGALLFSLSDSILAWSTFVGPLPLDHLLVMGTYYAAQALLALSAAQGRSARPKAS
ncbi:Lysoplasmalogenase [Galemys pyrenaicus]|uniref:Lysoplasmalogenase TMEM86B n=1 Tax=Galemys pyrenaicus TaxID=202257 RepID=A0A8J6ALS1_GALPY|nr:Lysoplasmalogenase [Galemys pyrenaicus]